MKAKILISSSAVGLETNINNFLHNNADTLLNVDIKLSIVNGNETEYIALLSFLTNDEISILRA